MSLTKRAWIPLLFTLANGICGFAAVTYAARIPRGLDQYDAAVITWLWAAGWCIIAAMLFDCLDGRLARLTRSASDFGGELDSLCDAISFGVAPGFLLLKLSEPDAFPIEVLWAIAVFYVLCVALRLARFNAQNSPDEAKHQRFAGLPSPAAAGVIAGVALVRHQLRTPSSFLGQLIAFFELNAEQVERLVAVTMPLVAICLGLLMISRLPYPHATSVLLSGRVPWRRRLALAALLGIAAAVLREFVVPVVFTVYSFGIPILSAGLFIRNRILAREPVY